MYFVLHTPKKSVKIGYSAEPVKRIGSLQTASPVRLRLLGVCPGGMQDEAELHTRFAHLHLRGEWFRYTPELEEALKELCAGHRLFGRCPRCGAPSKHLHEIVDCNLMGCDDCDPAGMPRTLRQGREHHAERFPAGGGYRLLRKPKW